MHNDTDEAWEDVQIELANGEPDSFLFPLAAPRYADRELRTPDVDLSTVSQLATVTADELWNESSVARGGMGVGGYGSAGSGFGGGGSAHGIGAISVQPAILKTAEVVETPTQFIYQVGRARRSASPSLGAGSDGPRGNPLRSRGGVCTVRDPGTIRCLVEQRHRQDPAGRACSRSCRAAGSRGSRSSSG